MPYAVEVLKVRHRIGCGGVIAALDNFRHGMIGNDLAVHHLNFATTSTRQLFCQSPAGDEKAVGA